MGEIREKTVGFQPFSRNYHVSMWYYSMPREKDTFVRVLKQLNKSPSCSYILKTTYAIHLPLEKKAFSSRILGKTGCHLAHQVGARTLRVLKMLTSPNKRFLVFELQLRFWSTLHPTPDYTLQILNGGCA